jgi:uncharacterized protein (TIGR03437 family)
MVGSRAFYRVRIRLMPVACLCLASPGFHIAGATWTQQQELTASDGATGDQFGNSVSLSGDTAVIGAADRNAYQGAAYVFVQSGGVWSQQQELIASDGVGNDAFGNSVSVSGDTAVIGASGKNTGQGAAYVFVRTGGVWSQQQELTASDGAVGDNFGWSVSLNGNTAVIGASGKTQYQGAAYVFALSGGTWRQQQKLSASDSAVGDKFGASVSLSGNTAMVGAAGKNSSQGATYVFVQSGTAWSQRQELTASDGAAGDWFGGSVSVSGNTALIGAWAKAIDAQTQQGAAYVFVQSGGAWSQQQELTASDGTGNDGFGNSVSLSGDTAAIGASGKAGYQGAVYVFALCGGAWSQQQELTASDGAAYDAFGYSVSLIEGTVVVGALNNTVNWQGFQGAAYVFTGTQPSIGSAISLGDFGGFFSAAPGSWVEIYGSNLASTTRPWTTADFSGNSAPTSLDGVQATIGDQPVFIEYVSPGQVNAQLPSSIGTGSLQLTVTSAGVASAPVNVTVNATQPGLLAPPSFNIGGNQYVVAQLPDGTYVVPAGAIAGVNSRPAQPGETIAIYGIGFGPVVPDIPAGQIATGTSQLAASLQFLFAQTPAQQVPYAGLAPGFVGLYQFDIVVPAVPDSDLVPLTLNLGGVPGTQTLYTAVHR